jgi:hypothetical protein
MRADTADGGVTGGRGDRAVMVGQLNKEAVASHRDLSAVAVFREALTLVSPNGRWAVKDRVKADDKNVMDAASPGQAPGAALVAIIDFKWLLASEGLHVHVERLQRDRPYALECLAHAAASPCDAVRAAGLRLRKALGLGTD